MRHLHVIAAAGISLLFASNAWAATSNSQYLIDQLTQGGPSSIRGAAESIYQMHETDHAILDVLAETMLQKYPTASSNDMADAVSWACKGLAASGDKRYYSAVKEVADGVSNRKTRKYCSNAAGDLGGADGTQYTKGSASLAKTAVKPAAPEKNKVAKEKSEDQPKQSGNYQPITEVKIGMSAAQVYSMVGQPDATTNHITGKAFIPFNFRGKDSVRTAALYKGQGRIVFSNSSSYSSNMNVLEVIVNPNETGYP